VPISLVIMQYELNSANNEEWKEVADLEAESFPADEAASPETIQFRIANAGKYFFTYRNREGELAGFVNGTCIVGLTLLHDSMTNHEPTGRTLVIHSVTVRESLRRHHLGTAMLKEYILKMKDELSIDYILLLSKAHMLSFYVNCGFQINKLSDVSHGQVPLQLDVFVVAATPVSYMSVTTVVTG
jgi:ribosomal protein S18 acetylase RimI-like enzyme